MLTPDQIDAIRDKIENITEPLNQYLIRNIVRRIREAGSITSTARYEAEIARMLGVSQREIREYFKTLIPAEKGELNRLYKQVARLTYKQTVATTGVNAVKLNPALNNVVNAAVKLADDDFTNITQTLGMIDPYGNALPLRDAYVSACDFAMKQVMTGASDYQTAVRNAVKNVAKYGVQVVDYESGVHSSLDVAVRRSVFGGMGLMVEEIEQQAAKDIGADGWEISAHEASAKDHEPYQGRQYSDEEFFKLNGTPEEAGILKRRIGTLNCKHVAFPILLGVSQPQYTEEELNAMAKRNEEGLEYQGKHYTMYEATQMQRKLERRIRKAKREVIAYEEAGLTDDLAKAKGKYNALMGAYSDFNKASGLRPQPARLEVLGFGPKQAKNPTPEPAIFGSGISINSGPTQKETSVVKLDRITIDGEEYVVDGNDVKFDENRNGEEEIAELMRQHMKADVYLLPTVNNPPNVRTPDYLINGITYDLKRPEPIGEGKHALYNVLHDHNGQSTHFIIDLVNFNAPPEEIERQVYKDVFRSRWTEFVEQIIIIRDGKIEKIYNRK